MLQTRNIGFGDISASKIERQMLLSKACEDGVGEIKEVLRVRRFKPRCKDEFSTAIDTIEIKNGEPFGRVETRFVHPDHIFPYNVVGKAKRSFTEALKLLRRS